MLRFLLSNCLLLRAFIVVLGFGDSPLLDLDLLPHSKFLLGSFDLGGGFVIVEDDGFVIHLIGTALLGGGGGGRFLDAIAILLLRDSDGGLLIRRGEGLLGRGLSASGFGLLDGRRGDGFTAILENANLVLQSFGGAVYRQG